VTKLTSCVVRSETADVKAREGVVDDEKREQRVAADEWITEAEEQGELFQMTHSQFASYCNCVK